MIKDFFTNLSKGQIVIIALLMLLVATLLIPKIPIWYHASTSKEYEPWDPDNINNIKDQIKKLNTESDQINFQLEVLPAYEQEIAYNRVALSTVELDSVYVNTLLKIQPNKIISNIENYYDVTPENSSSVSKLINKTFSAQINSKRIAFAKEYIFLTNSLGYTSPFTYFDTYPGTLKNTDLYPITNFDFSKGNRNNDTASKKTINIKLDASKPQNNGAALETKKKSFEKSKLVFIDILNQLDSLLKQRIVSDKERKESLMSDQDKLKDEFNKKNFNINQYAVVIGIPFFIIAALLMYWYGLRSDKSKNSASSIEMAMDPKDKLSFALNAITVLILILSLLILGLAKVIAENTLAALLGTIGGYVLNNSKNKDAFPK